MYNSIPYISMPYIKLPNDLGFDEKSRIREKIYLMYITKIRKYSDKSYKEFKKAIFLCSIRRKKSAEKHSIRYLLYNQMQKQAAEWYKSTDTAGVIDKTLTEYLKDVAKKHPEIKKLI